MRTAMYFYFFNVLFVSRIIHLNENAFGRIFLFEIINIVLY